MIDQAKLEGLLDKWEQARERGEDLSVGDLCHGCPELEHEVRLRIRALKATEWMLEDYGQDSIDLLPLPSVEAMSAQLLVPDSLTMKQFKTNITASGLMTEGELSNYDASDPCDLAAQLLRNKKLTKYQAESIVEGHTEQLVVGNYVVLEKIGAGGMGHVFKARHRLMKRVVALKVLPHHVVDSPTAVKRFHREVEAAAKLEHPHIVTAYDADESDGTHFLVMQFVEGQDLAAVVRHRGPMSVAKAVDCVIQAARGLVYAHGVGIVHRDIKPANLLLDNRGIVKILDMGLARLETNGGEGGSLTSTQLTQDGSAMGTVDFMSPEQALDSHDADVRSDIYSLGCTLFFLLTGKPVYEGKTLLAKIMNHRDAEIPLLHQVRNGVPSELAAVFEKMVAKEPDDRYQTAAALLKELASLAEGLDGDESAVDTISPKETTVDMRSEETATASLDGTLHPLPEPKPVSPTRRISTNKWMGIGIAVLSMVILGGIIFKIQTPDGIIQIESNVPDFEVLVDNEKVVYVTDPNDQKRIRVEVKRGAKLLSVSKEGFYAKVSEFSLKTVDGPISVTFLRDEDQDEIPTTAGGDPNRRVAEWVIGVGGKVVIEGQEAEIARIEDLPKKDLRVAGVNLQGDAWLDREGFSLLGKLESLDSLRVDGNSSFSDELLKRIRTVPITEFYAPSTSLTDDGVKLLSPRDLSLLWAARTQLTDETLLHLRSKAPNIGELDLSFTRVTDQGMSHFADHPLRNLNLLGCPGITDKTIDVITRWTASNHGFIIHLGKTVITNEGLRRLAGLPGLSVLWVHDTEISDEGIAHLVAAKDLLRLDLTGTKVTAQAVAELKKALPKCEIEWVERYVTDCQIAEWVLSVGGSVATFQDGQQFLKDADALPERLYRLHSVSLSGYTKLDEVAMQQLARLVDTTIVNLALDYTNITDGDLKHLQGLPLHGLGLAGTKVTDAGLQHLVGLPNLRLFALHETTITDTGLKHLEQLKSISFLTLANTKITEDGVAGLLKELPAIKMISLSGKEPWANHESLMRLQLLRPECEISLSMYSNQSPAYWVLWLGGTVRANVGGATSVAFAEPEGVPAKPLQITSIDFNDNPFLNDACTMRFKDYRGLKQLSLRNTRITNAAVKDLVPLTDLEQIDLTGTKITSEGIEAIKRALPACKVVWGVAGSESQD